MKRQGYFFDMARCIGCKACQVACKEHNKLSTGEFFRRVAVIEQDNNGGTHWTNFSGACNHCGNPTCVKVCPTGAMYKSADGTVQHDDSKCIGCSLCHKLSIWSSIHKQGNGIRTKVHFLHRPESKQPATSLCCGMSYKSTSFW